MHSPFQIPQLELVLAVSGGVRYQVAGVRCHARVLGAKAMALSGTCINCRLA